jgi:hypothetical protein
MGVAPRVAVLETQRRSLADESLDRALRQRPPPSFFLD